MGTVVSFINMKGGVGKTTLAVNVGYTLAKIFGKRVLLVDVDPQMNSTQYTLNEEQVLEIMDNPRKTIYGVLEQNVLPSITSRSPSAPVGVTDVVLPIRESFDIIPSHLQIMSLNLGDSPLRLKHFINNNGLKNKYDLLILDSPPTISAYTKVSLLASDAYVVPMKTDFLSLFGLPLLESYIGQLKDEFELGLRFLGIVLTMVRPDWRIYGQVKDRIARQEGWKSKLFTNELKYKTKVAMALSPDQRLAGLPYIIELGDNELEGQMVEITKEFMQKGRL